jgi:hypothetical protein
LKSTDVSDENVASIFKVEKLAEQGTSVQAGGFRSLLGLFFDR